MSTSTSKILTLVLIDRIKKFLYFPVWWYSGGFLDFLKFSWDFVLNMNNSLGIYIWLKHLFTPLYGITAWQDRIISFFLRLVQIIFRGLLFLIIIIITFLLILVWLILPFWLIYQLFA